MVADVGLSIVQVYIRDIVVIFFVMSGAYHNRGESLSQLYLVLILHVS